MLPSLHHLPLADRGKVANVPNRGRLADLPLELWQRIEHFLVEDCSLDSLLWISSWCTTHSKVCDDQWSKRVLETCFGARPDPVVPSTPNEGMILRMHDSNGKPVVAPGGGFWHRMLLQCVSELEQLPPLMSAAYLRSNEAQRARWASVFKHRGMYALRARVVMAGEPKLAPEINSAFHRSQLFIDFMRGEDITTDVKNTINKWIEEGWQFDWLLGAIFRKNVAKTLDHVQPSWFLPSFEGYFIPRMEMLLRHGINPVITSHDLNFAIPNVRLMKHEDHVQLEFLSRNIKFIIDNKIKIEFVYPSTPAHTRQYIESVYPIMRAIVNAYVDLPYAIERWEHELNHGSWKADLIGGLPPDYSKRVIEDAIKSLRRYEETVPQRLVELMVHLAHPHGSNAWEAARENTMSHFLNGGYLFFTEEHESAFRMALLETGRNVETGPIFEIAKQREWYPINYYDDAVKRMVPGPSESFITRMEPLLNQNIKPVLNSRDLNLLIPNVRRMKLKDRYQLYVLSNNIKFIVDKKIKIVFDSHPHTSENPSVRMIMQAIVNAYVDLPYAIYHWLIEYQRPGFIYSEDYKQQQQQQDINTDLQSFEAIVPNRLGDLMVHLTESHGSNAWEAAHDNTMSHFVHGGYLFFTEEHESLLIQALVG